MIKFKYKKNNEKISEISYNKHLPEWKEIIKRKQKLIPLKFNKNSENQTCRQVKQHKNCCTSSTAQRL